MASWLKIIGTQTGRFILGLTGVSIKNNSGTLDVKNNADTAYAPIKVEKITHFNNSAGFGNTWQVSATQAANYTYTEPEDDGSPGEVLSTDGSGVLSWVPAGSTAPCLTAFETTVNFGDSTPITMFTLPAAATVDHVTIIVDTAFDGTANLTVGVNGGSASEFTTTSDSRLQVADRYDVPYQGLPDPGTLDIEIAYAAGGASVGSARVIVAYWTPAT